MISERILREVIREELSSFVAPKLYSLDEAARTLGLSPATLNTWRSNGEGPAYIKVGGRVMYELRDLNKYIATRRMKTRGD